MLVNDIARRAGVSPHTVRYYERIGLLDAARDPDNRYRSFGVSAVTRLRFVRQAKRLGFRLGEIRALLDACARGTSPGAMAREIVHDRIAENASRLREMQRMQGRLEQALRQWARLPGGEPDAAALCGLIESLATHDSCAADDSMLAQ